MVNGQGGGPIGLFLGGFRLNAGFSDSCSAVPGRVGRSYVRETQFPRVELGFSDVENDFSDLWETVEDVEMGFPDLGEKVQDVEKVFPDREKDFPDVEIQFPRGEKGFPGLEKKLPGLEIHFPDAENPIPEDQAGRAVPV